MIEMIMEWMMIEAQKTNHHADTYGRLGVESMMTHHAN